MLSLALVQIIAGVGLVATAVGAAAGRPRNTSSRTRVRVVATNPPARGTQILWVGGALVATFWGLGAFAAPAYAYHWPAVPDFAGSWIIQIVGVVLSVTGGLLFWRSARTLGRHMTPFIQVREDHELVQTGPYRYIRHPVYTAILLTAAGQTLFFLSLPLASLTLFLVAMAVYRVRLEESLLSSPGGFGAAYQEYMHRTGRFLPRLRSIR